MAMKFGNDQTVWAEFSSLSDLASLQPTAALLRPSPPPTASHQYPTAFSWINMTNSCTHHTTSFWWFKAIVLLERLLDYSQNKCICSTPQCEIVSFHRYLQSPKTITPRPSNDRPTNLFQERNDQSWPPRCWKGSGNTNSLAHGFSTEESDYYEIGLANCSSILKSRSQYIPGT